MRLLTVRRPHGTQAARLDGDTVTLLPYLDVGEILAAGRVDGDLVGDETLDFSRCDLAPVIPAPGKIVCLGHSYRDHIEEMGRDLPSHPTLFAKFSEALIGANDPIVLPRDSTAMDWEAELAVIVGRTIRRASVEEAQDAIAGYSILNDITARDWQRRTLQWLQGKTFESTTPLGPALVTPEEVDHARDLRLQCEVDGEVVQESRTSQLVFGPADIVAYVSRIVTLRPGDVISTGTPGGVGDARSPAVYLRPGQVVRTIVEGLGELVNRCVEEDEEAWVETIA